MRFIGVVLLMLGISMIYYLGYKGLTVVQMIGDLEKFFGFQLASTGSTGTKMV